MSDIDERRRLEESYGRLAESAIVERHESAIAEPYVRKERRRCSDAAHDVFAEGRAKGWTMQQICDALMGAIENGPAR